MDFFGDGGESSIGHAKKKEGNDDSPVDLGQEWKAGSHKWTLFRG